MHSKFLFFILAALNTQQVQAARKARTDCAENLSPKVIVTETSNMLHYFLKGSEAYSLMNELVPTISFGPKVYTFYFEKEDVLKPYSMLDGGSYGAHPLVEGHPFGQVLPTTFLEVKTLTSREAENPRNQEKSFMTIEGRAVAADPKYGPLPGLQTDSINTGIIFSIPKRLSDDITESPFGISLKGRAAYEFITAFLFAETGKPRVNNRHLVNAGVQYTYDESAKNWKLQLASQKESIKVIAIHHEDNGRNQDSVEFLFRGQLSR